MRQILSNLKKLLPLLFTLLIPANLHSMAIAQFPWDKIAATGIAALSGCFAKFEYNNPTEFTIARSTKFKNLSNQSPLATHLKTDLLLGPVLKEVLIAKQLNFSFQIPQLESIIDMRRTDTLEFYRAISKAYALLRQGDFYGARLLVQPFTSPQSYGFNLHPGRAANIDQFFKAFQANFYNDYNILTRYQDDPLWANLPEKTKKAIANDTTLRMTMNLELVLRHEMLLKLQSSLGLADLNYKGLKPFLFSFMCLSPQVQLDTLLKMLAGHDLFNALYNHNGILRAFNGHPYTAAHTIPTDFSNLQMRLYTKRMNELLYYNLQTKDKATFEIAAAAIAEGLRGDPFYAHLAHSTMSPMLISDFITEVQTINLYLNKEPKTQKNPTNPNQKNKNHLDPKYTAHEEKITSMLCANAAIIRFAQALSERLEAEREALQRLIYVTRIQVYHIFHGEIGAHDKISGCHSYFGRCCFQLQRVFSIGKETLSDVVQVIKNGQAKTSTFIPGETIEENIEFLCNAVKHGTFSVSKGYSPLSTVAKVNFSYKGLDLIICINTNTETVLTTFTQIPQ